MKILLFLVMMLPVMVTAQQITFEEHTGHGITTGVDDGVIVSADVNGDGNADIFIVGITHIVQQTMIATLYLGDGNGGFSPAPTQPFIELARADAQFGDIDGDGDMDLVVTGGAENDTQTHIYLNDGVGNFTLFATLLGAFHGGVALGDLDNDGDLDIVVTGFLPGNGRLTAVYRNDGTHFTTVSTGMENLKGGDVAIFDYNNDGKLDVMISGGTGVAIVTHLYQNNGNFNFSLVSGTPFVGVGYASFAIGDIDGNGFADVIITGEAAGNNRVTEVYRNNGSVFTHSQSLPGTLGGDVQLGDFDNDGNLDVFIVGGVGGNNAISRLFRNDGTGEFIFAQNFSPGLSGASAVLLDFDNDGKLDLIYTGLPIGGVIPLIKVFRNTTQTMSIDDFNAESVVMYPNPTRGQLYVELPNGLEITGIVVTDMLGRSVATPVVGNRIDISHFSSGIYLVTVQSDGAQVTKRVVKN